MRLSLAWRPIALCRVHRLRFASLGMTAALVGWAAAAPQPVPRMQAVPQPYEQVSFQRDGVELARYHYGPGLKRPFVFPLNGPSGRSLTRMGHPRDPQSHSHHNSVWLSHQNAGEVNFWEDRPGPRIAHQRMQRMEDGEDSASIEVLNAWLDKEAKTVLHERRRLTVQALPDGEWLLLIDTQLDARDAEVILGQTPFGLIGVRMAKTIGVHDGAGTIRNSEGGIDEIGCFRKPARWVDYSGAITPAASEGITLLDHPRNLNHPVPFHVRNDGWMGAALTFPGAHGIKPGEPLRLRYGLYV
ncbi:MAG: PmoA family protein, partial [Verrucomicrobiota bacterium]|nr:PmoA family protein [Verrucomicrobiota bacterium]